MGSRHITTAITLVVLVGILVLGLVVGFRELFAPLPSDEGDPAAAASPSCEPRSVRPGQRRVKTGLRNVACVIGEKSTCTIRHDSAASILPSRVWPIRL